MFTWEGCPVSLFDMYIEIGDIKFSNNESSDCAFVEVWIASVFSSDHVRSECRSPRREPIYSVIKQIQKLSDNKPVCVLFMCDDVCDDTADWVPAIDLMLQELKELNILKYAVMYTKDAYPNISNRTRRENERKKYINCLQSIDVIISGQANRYSSADSKHVVVNNKEALPALSEFLQL